MSETSGDVPLEAPDPYSQLMPPGVQSPPDPPPTASPLSEDSIAAAGRRHPGARIAFLALKWGLVAGAVLFFGRLLRGVDWPVVWDAVTHLEAWQALSLLAIVLLRAAVASTPLALFVPGLGMGRAVVNDLAGNMVSTVTPPPADIVIRSTMFHSWDVPVARGLAGLVLNTLFFYVSRLAAPVLGFLLMWAVHSYDETFAWTALVSGLGAAGLGVILALSMRSGPAAAATGRWAGRTLQRLRTSWPGPEDLEVRFTEFFGNIAGVLHRRWPGAAGATLLQPVVESMLLVAAVRFIGVPAADAPAALIVASFLVAYPMTALPFFGIGVLDAAIVALIADRAPVEATELVAALVIWRVYFQLVPLVLGAGVFGTWKWRTARSLG